MGRTELTRRGWSLFGAAVGLLVAGRLLGTAELSSLGLCAIALLVGTWWWTRTRPTPVTLHRSVQPERVHVGGAARVDLEIGARGASPQLRITDAFDGGRRAARFLSPALDPGQRGRAAYRIPTDHRGRFAIGPATVGISDPFGLTDRTVTLTEIDEVTVRPRVHELLPVGGTPGPRRAAADRRAAVPVPATAPDEFLALREYQTGDDLRRVHWRSSARLGELMVREDESTWRPETVLLLDNRADGYRAEEYEWAIEVVASVGARLLRSRTGCDITTTDGRRLGVGAGGHSSSESRLLDELATIAQHPGPLGSLAAFRSDMRRGLLVVVTGSPSDVARFVALAGPGAPVIVVTTNPDAFGSAPTATVIDGRPGAFVAAWNAAMAPRPSTRRHGRAS